MITEIDVLDPEVIEFGRIVNCSNCSGHGPAYDMVRRWHGEFICWDCFRSEI